MSDSEELVESAEGARTMALAGELRVLIGQLRRRLREQGSVGDLTGSQLAALRRLESEGPITVTMLARAEGMRPQSMGANVGVLEAAGLVSGTPDPKDGRQTVLSLTPKCREMIQAGRMAREDWLFRVLNTHFSQQEREELERATALLKRLAQSEA